MGKAKKRIGEINDKYALELQGFTSRIYVQHCPIQGSDVSNISVFCTKCKRRAYTFDTGLHCRKCMTYSDSKTSKILKARVKLLYKLFEKEKFSTVL